MLRGIKSSVKPLFLDEQVLEAAYGLYMSAPPTRTPAISLQRLAKLTGKTPLRCRNAIVEWLALGQLGPTALPRRDTRRRDKL